MSAHNLSPFGTRNNSGYWAIIIDGLWQVLRTKAEADRMVAAIEAQGHIDDSPFGGWAMLPPGYIPVFWSPTAPEGAPKQLDLDAPALLGTPQADVWRYIALAKGRAIKRMQLRDAHEAAATTTTTRLRALRFERSGGFLSLFLGSSA